MSGLSWYFVNKLSTILGSTGQQATPVRYAVVRGASDGKKYVLLGGSSALSVAGYKTPLQVDFTMFTIHKYLVAIIRLILSTCSP